MQCIFGDNTWVLWYDLKLVGNRIGVIVNRNMIPKGQVKFDSLLWLSRDEIYRRGDVCEQ